MSTAATAGVGPGGTGDERPPFGRVFLVCVLAGCAAASLPDRLARLNADERALPREKSVGKIELVAAWDAPMPTGVAVSHDGRLFVNFPRWGDRVDFTVAEVKDGKPVPYPDAAVNRPDSDRPGESFLSVQSVVVDARDRLWVLDTGSIEFAATEYGGPKLVGVDLRQNRIVQKILLPREVALPRTYLNDVRFDLGRGKGGLAFITDSTDQGPNGIIVVDLASGRSWRRLHDHPSTRGEKGFLPFVEGQPLLLRPVKGPPRPIRFGVGGIALGHDGQRLFYCALASRRLYSVRVDALARESLSEEEVARTVEDHGEKGASDGLEADAEGRLYLTDYEHNAIHRRRPDGRLETLVHDPRVLWPDSLFLARDGYLYFTVNQLHRQPAFQEGKDRREKPYSVFRVRVDARPVLLR
jgi:sugar lactone lactonase YvrE